MNLGQITRWVWDGNTPLHEWRYELADRPRTVRDEFGFESKDRPEPTDHLVTWVFEEGTFKPAAKITSEQRYSILTDYLGTPVQMYDGQGELSWQAQLDVYGKVRTFTGASATDCPFRYQGQYEDEETGLYYNRFRYYSPEMGGYISQDPIGLAGGNPTLYGYVSDTNSWLDPFGLDLHHIIPQAIWRKINKEFDNALKDVEGYVQNVTKKAADVSNLIDLDKPFHGNHPSYSEFVEKQLRGLVGDDNLNLSSVKKLQGELRNLIDKAKDSGRNLNDYFANGFSPKCK